MMDTGLGSEVSSDDKTIVSVIEAAGLNSFFE